MSPITVATPPSKKSYGRQPRLSPEDVRDLANSIEGGHWATDNEPVDSQGAAYQRAQSARDLIIAMMPDSFSVTRIKTATESVDVGTLTKPQKAAFVKVCEGKGFDEEKIKSLTKVWFWKIGPRPEGEKPRKKPTRKPKEKSGATQQA